MKWNQMLRTWRLTGGNLLAEFAAGLIAPTVQQNVATVVYGPTPTPDFLAGNLAVITVTNNVAFQVQAPANPPTGAGVGALLTITIRNASGGATGAITWAAVYKLAALVAPANNTSKSITFRWDGTNWVEISRTPADVPN